MKNKPIKLFIKISLLLLLPAFAVAQSPQSELDSLLRAVEVAKNDTIRMDVYKNLGSYYDDVNLDSAVNYFEKAINIAKQLQLKVTEADLYGYISFPLDKMGNYPRSLKLLNQALDIADNPAYEKYIYNLSKGESPESYRLGLIGWINESFASLYGYTGNYDKSIVAANEAIRIAESFKNTAALADNISEKSHAYLKLNKPDSAIYFGKMALTYNEASQFHKFQANIYIQNGEAYLQKEDTLRAKENFEKAILVGVLYNNPVKKGEAHLQLARLFQSQNKIDSSLYHSKEALAILKLAGKEKSTTMAYRMISDCYGSLGKPDSSFVYLRQATLLNDKLDKAENEKIQEFQVAGFEEALRAQELEKEKIETQNKTRTYGLLAGLAILSIIGFILYRNNRQKQKANAVLETTLSSLKSTQSQLIQSEKMASLGELTAGIAHEIQNPLNFVNNFSEVSSELIDEMNEEIAKGNLEDAKQIAEDLKQNLKKINHHGKRAGDIVKGMLQHSRSSSGVKEPTDINKLADEYLRLAYHGLRAKDKSFNATMNTDYDLSIGSINLIPQDIGRVILNLITNAFYVVNERQKLLATSHELLANYEPTVSVNTKKVGNKVMISVKDNGNGIPQKIVDKIFQPFFTTKPTGQGTGLGLSLSYDIVKAHGGELKVETKEDEGTVFTFALPL